MSDVGVAWPSPSPGQPLAGRPRHAPDVQQWSRAGPGPGWSAIGSACARPGSGEAPAARAFCDFAERGDPAATV